jgi:hypothetical protein
MNLHVAAQVARGLAHRRSSAAHIRCTMENLGDRMLDGAIRRLLARIQLIDYAPSRLLSTVSAINPRSRLFRFTCLGGGTLIFGDIDRGWGAALEHAMARTETAFSIGTGVIDPTFREDLHRRFNLRPLPADTVSRWVECLRRFELVSVRGNDSARLLQERGVTHVEVTGDPALVYAHERPVPKARSRRVGINVANRSYFFDNANERVIGHFAGLIRQLAATGWTVTLYPMGPEDSQVTREVCEQAGVPDVEVRSWRAPLAAIIDHIGSQDVFVGVRLHSVVSAICSYTPAIMVGYQPKNLEMMETLGLPDHCTRIDQFDQRLMVDLIEQLQQTAESVQERQFAACCTFKQRLFAFRDRIYELAAR